MPRSAVTIAPDLTTDTTWRALIGAIKTGIEAMGWVQTSDTGQINFSTSTKPAAANTFQGYALWRAADSLAGTNPMILRLRFGSAGSATQFRLEAQFGYQTDGAGTFSGITNFWSFGNMDGPSSATTTAYNCYFSGDTNRLAFLLFDNYTPNADQNILIGMERTHDNTGADTTFGIFAFIANGGGSNQNTRVVPYSGNMFSASVQFIGARQGNISSSVMGTQVGTFPVFPFYIVFLNPSTQLITHFIGDITAGTIFTTDMYGATRTFLVTRAIKGAIDQDRCSIRWDT